MAKCLSIPDLGHLFVAESLRHAGVDSAVSPDVIGFEQSQSLGYGLNIRSNVRQHSVNQRMCFQSKSVPLVG